MCVVFGASFQEKNRYYSQAKKAYLQSVLNGDKQKEVLALKRLIRYGSELHIDIQKYKDELNKYEAAKAYSQKKTSKVSPKDKKYSIQRVYTTKDSIVVEFNKQTSVKDLVFTETKSKNLYRDIFDLSGRFKDAAPTKLRLPGIDKIVIFQYKFNTLRIILEHTSNPQTIYIVHKNKIIIRNIGNKSNKTANNKTSVPSFPQDYVSSKVVVIDPGHGGKDPGAVNGRWYEKNIVFRISKYIKKELDAMGYKVYLTRYSDKAKALRNRTAVANNKNADIFVSIHTNAIGKAKAHKVQGVETFFLSPARNERAKRVAMLENQSDMRSMNYSSKNAFLESLNRSRITASHKLSIDIHANMLYNLQKKYKVVKDGGVREGPFWVLVGAQMPSVLVEVGYLSHPQESKRIRTTAYQKLVAKSIADGINAYFLKNPQ